MHYAEKTHFFRDDQDNRIAVTTTLLPNGEYAAYVVDNDNCDDHRHGIGKTRMEAIADLQAQLDDDQ